MMITIPGSLPHFEHFSFSFVFIGVLNVTNTSVGLHVKSRN